MADEKSGEKAEKKVKKAATPKPSIKDAVASAGGEVNKDGEGWIDPSKVVIYGRDSEEQENSFLADQRAFNQPDADMLEEMAENGVRERVKLVQAKVDGKWVLVPADGRQRTINLRAANEIRAKKGLPELRLPFKIIPLEGTALLQESVILNEHRISDDPISRAMKAKAMIDKGVSTKDVARAFRVKESTLKKQWLPVLGMSESIVEAVKSGRFALNAAIELVSLTPEEQESKFKELEEAGQLNMAAAEAARRAVRGGGEASEDGDKKAYKPMSKKDMAAFVAWSDEAGKSGNVAPYEEFHLLGLDKDGNPIAARVVLRELFQHLLGKKTTPSIPGWKAMMKRMYTPVEEEEAAAEPEAEEKPKKKAKKG